MKKVLVFGYTMDMGGAEKALSDTLNYLVKYCEIDLYLLNPTGVLMDSLPKNINIYKLKKNIVFYILFRFIPFFRRLVINRIANKKDYYVAFGYMEGRSGTWVADINKKIKKYAWIHNDVSKFDIGIREKEIKSTYSQMDKVICVSNQAKDIFCEKYNIPSTKVEVIYNYINEKEIIKKAQEFKVNNNVYTFVNVAKMRDQKRQDRLVKAAKYLKDLGYEFKIQLIGDGPNFEKIKSLVEELKVTDKVELLGLQTNPYPYIKSADFFVLSSFMEGYGIVIKEALFLGTKVLTTDIVGPREILKNGEYGIIVNNDEDSLKYEMQKILDNKNSYKKLEKKIKEYKGDNEEIMRETLKLLDLCL